MENSFYHELRRWRNILQQSATKYFHCIMISEAERPFRQTHPAVFNSPSHPQSSGPQRSIIPPLERDAFSSTHEFIQLLRRRRTHHHHIQPNREREPRRGRKENRKGINHIYLVSVHSIQHTFWPSCGVKRNGLRWRGQDVTSRQIWTFVVDEGEQCERRRWR